MTAKMVAGFGQQNDYISQIAMGQNQNSQGDFGEIFKASSKEVTEKDNIAVAKNETRPDYNALKSDEAKVSENVTGNKLENRDKNAEVRDNSDDMTEEVNASTKKELPVIDEDETEVPEEVLEEVMSVVNQLISDIAKTLDVTENQVNEAIKDLGLTEVDLLNPKIIPMLAVELTDASDTTDIMTDEKLFADVSKLMNLTDESVKELASELDLTPDELIGEIKKSFEQEAELDVSDEVEILRNEEGIDDLEDAINQKFPVDEGKNIKLSGDIVRTEDTIKKDDVSRRNLNDVSDDAKAVGAERIKTDNKAEYSKEEGKKESGEGQSGMLTQSTLDILRNNLTNTVNRESVSYADVQGRIDNIMEQVTENLRFTMNQDITEMEMQLHPASLGNIKVQVALKDGAITASFTASNEQVREALETQVTTLKEQLNDQGIKVEAVEVTVSSHAFERNLNEEGEKRERQSEEVARTRRPRRINLNGITADDIEELDEEDRVTADMMARNGNTVDYLA